MAGVQTGKRAWIPLSIIYIFTFFYFNIYHTVSGQYSLRQTCLDLGLAPDCNTKEALRKVAEFSLPALLIPGLVSILSIGVIGAISNRLGRKNTLALGILGQFFAPSGWALVYFFPDQFAAHWQICVIGGASISSIAGGILILYLAIFGMVSDVSARQPSLRTTLYVVFDLIAGISGVLGAQAAGYLMQHDSRILLGIVCIGLFLNVLSIFIILPETLEDSVRMAPIDTRKANTLGQLAFLLPFESTKKMLAADHDKILQKITQLYNEQNPDKAVILFDESSDAQYVSPIMDGINGDTLRQHSLSSNQSTINQLELNLPQYEDDEAMTFGVAAEALASGINNLPITFDELQYANGITNTVMHDSPIVMGLNGEQSPTLSTTGSDSSAGYPSPAMLPSSTHRNGQKSGVLSPSSRSTKFIIGDDDFRLGENDSIVDEKRQGLLQDTDLRSDGDESSAKKSRKSKKSSRKKNDNIDYRGVPYLKLSAPPRRIPHANSFLLLVLCLFLLVLNFLGYAVVALYYLKKVMKITSAQYSNILSVAAIVRGVGSFIVFPIFKKFIHTPTQEKYFLVGLCLMQAAVFVLLPQCKTFFQFCCGVILYYLANTFPSGIIRSLLSNQVSQQLQQHVLSAIAAAEVFVFVFGGVGFNLVWLKTQDEHPAAVIYCWSIISLIAAALPLLISDSTDDFNLRIEMTTQYTKIRSAEKKWEEKQQQTQKEEEKASFQQTLSINGGDDYYGKQPEPVFASPEGGINGGEDYLMAASEYAEAV